MKINVIDLNNVDKYYDSYHALKNISLNVEDGQIYSYLGPNGSGKTTTIKMILGLLKPSSGSVEILGEDPYLDNIDSLHVRERIGSMLEWDGLYLNLTGLENVVYWAEIFGQNKIEAHKNAVDAIQKVKLSDWADKLVSKYSHGMKKRLSFARAIINDPDILVLDEPTSGIDPESRILIRDLMMNFVKKGKTIFFSSHDLEEVQKISSSLSILNKGKIIFKGSLEELIKTFGQKEIYIQMKTPEDANSLIQKFKNNVTNIKIKGPVLSFIPNEGYKPDLENKNIISSWNMESNIEDAYLNAISSTKGGII